MMIKFNYVLQLLYIYIARNQPSSENGFIINQQTGVCFRPLATSLQFSADLVKLLHEHYGMFFKHIDIDVSEKQLGIWYS